ncbi:MAG: hypothetical protein WAM82_04185 [Thermoanaerobaculia bacterium]
MALNKQLERYLRARSFGSPEGTKEFLQRGYVFHRAKRFYFDEVENANVWSFYLVERDLHHTFEEFVLSLGLPPYAIWSKHGTNAINAARVTFPISETASIFRAPVPIAGQTIEYALEVLHIGNSSAIFGFLGFLHDEDSTFAKSPSVAAAWLRVLVEYSDDDSRTAIRLPDRLKKYLTSFASRDFMWS